MARPTHAGRAYKPSSDLVTHAWTDKSPYIDEIHNPKLLADGTIEVDFDYPTVSLLVIDREKSLSGYARAGPDDTSIDVEMLPSANYGGTILDENGEPLADRTIRLVSKSAYLVVVESGRTDEKGRFQFSDVAVRMPLQLYIENERGLPEYRVSGLDRLFEPGEERKNDTVELSGF